MGNKNSLIFYHFLLRHSREILKSPRISGRQSLLLRCIESPVPPFRPLRPCRSRPASCFNDKNTIPLRFCWESPCSSPLVRMNGTPSGFWGGRGSWRFFKKKRGGSWRADPLTPVRHPVSPGRGWVPASLTRSRVPGCLRKNPAPARNPLLFLGRSDVDKDRSPYGDQDCYGTDYGCENTRVSEQSRILCGFRCGRDRENHRNDLGRYRGRCR